MIVFDDGYNDGTRIAFARLKIAMDHTVQPLKDISNDEEREETS